MRPTARCMLAALAIATLAAAEQPLLLPMPELLKWLDRGQEWLMLPLADYQALVAAGTRPVPDAAQAPGGAWIETARISAQLEDDRRLRLRAELEIDAAVAEAATCRLFARAPDALGLATLDGAPALLVRRPDGGIDLLAPGAGRHRATIAWTAELAAGADGARGTVPLPLAAGLAAAITAERPGELLGGGLVASGDRTWTLVSAGAGELALAWHPGRQGGATAAAWGVEQTLQVALPTEPGAPRPWRWTARPAVLRGEPPASLVLRLPAGWTATTPGPGVREPAVTADGGLLLRIDPGASELVLDGIAAAGAPIALPAVDGALWQGGRVVLTAADRVDWILPARWRRLAAEEAGWRVFAVPGPDAGLTLIATASGRTLAADVSTSVALGPERWRMETAITVPGGADRIFALPIRLPAGWRAIAGSCSVPARIAGADATGAFAETPADGVLRISLPQGLSAAGGAIITLVLEREPAEGPVEVAPPQVIDAATGRHRLVVAAAPSLDVQVEAAGWRRDDAAQVPDSAAGRTVRAVLLAAGAVPALRLTTAAKRPGCDAEAVAWLLPLDGASEAAVWCRLDLRLTVSDGELDTVAVELPLLPGSERLADPGLTLVRDGARTLLRASRPWRGERLVRIEGRLAGGEGRTVAFPRLAIAGADGAAVPTLLHVAVQAPDRLDLRFAPGPAAQAEDEDDLPRWSRPIPGDPLAGAWRLGAGEAGGFSLVSRPLVDPPRGFVHRLEVRTQLGAGRARSLLRLRLAAPGLDALPLRLPAGATLVAAALDGRPVAVRQVEGDAVLPLPGRTQVDVVLLLDGPIAEGRVDLALPGLGGLPVTSVAWTVAADVAWRIRPGEDAEAMHLEARGEEASRPWFRSWQAAEGAIDSGGAPAPAVAVERAGDPRLLPTPAKPPVLGGEPTLALVGQLWSGERLGVARLALAYRPLSGLRRSDHVGAALALLVGAWLAWRLRPLAVLAVAAAALATAAALHVSAIAWGPLLAFGEWLAPVLAVALAVRAVARRFAPTAVNPLEAAP